MEPTNEASVEETAPAAEVMVLEPNSRPQLELPLPSPPLPPVVATPAATVMALTAAASAPLPSRTAARPALTGPPGAAGEATLEQCFDIATRLELITEKGVDMLRRNVRSTAIVASAHQQIEVWRLPLRDLRLICSRCLRRLRYRRRIRATADQTGPTRSRGAAHTVGGENRCRDRPAAAVPREPGSAWQHCARESCRSRTLLGPGWWR